MTKFNLISFTAVLVASISVSNAQAESIPDGTYNATFGIDNCGVLVSTPTSLKYTYGPCGKEPTYTAVKVSRRGNNVAIDQAKFLDFEIDKQGNLRGKWVLGDYNTMKVFRRK